MNTVEEKLWNYIDGTCSEEEQKAIGILIAQDETYKRKYEELLALNQEFSKMELDEPSMAFTYNVMENIRTQNASVPLKAAINKKIILGISIFFIVTLLASLAFMFANVKVSGGLTVSLPNYVKMPAIDAGKARLMVQCFVFFDVMLGLYLFDAFLRRKRRERSA